MSNIKVLVRFRKPANSLPFTTIAKNEVFVESNGVRYNFDRVFVKESNKSIYEYLKEGIVCGGDLECAINSYTGGDGASTNNTLTIMCYGSTGSGKTFTMLGNKKEKGIFQLIRDTYDILEFKCFELYNERVIVRTENVQDVGTFEGMLVRKRTALNEESSRSHTIMEMVVQQNKSNHGKIFKIILIDLAGSEDNRKTGNSPQSNPSLMKESSTINKSLFVLRNVITAIYKKRKSVPFRESVLTKYLKEYFKGRVVLLATVVDDCEMMGEGISTLNFASMSKRIVWKDKIREKRDGCNELIERLYKGKNFGSKERPVLDEKVNFEKESVRRPVRRAVQGDKSKKKMRKSGEDFVKANEEKEELTFTRSGDTDTGTRSSEGAYDKIVKNDVYGVKSFDENCARVISDDKAKCVPKIDVNENRICDISTTFSSTDIIVHSFDGNEQNSDRLVNKKVFDVILKRARQFEEQGCKRKALENYKMLLEMTEEDKNSLGAGVDAKSKEIHGIITDVVNDTSRNELNDQNNATIDELHELVNFKVKNDVRKIIDQIKTKISNLSATKTKPSLITKKELLKLLNKADFLSLKKIKNIGDKRALKIIEYLKFKRIGKTEDLCKIFSKRVVDSIMKNVTE
ncbi:hypothetical protein VCUG_02590 [Vavraia culicis subsp. floridensis]|uniref:Kinesin motor domain-containing protein n=1 Tax=Vavraia culicis (isolate floridensis) TaxID=948595 RepID=L2GQK0_VAVCU|nr:uncharacterized protein VCUG_02590 [Vavraia culicis subsp. floridensis]ELA45921.1 hypothetical protein VCUG_02590 [Vavraia culicis subsp. floridensis]